MPPKGAIQGSADARRLEDRFFFLLVLRAPLGLPGFHLVQPGLEALARPPQHAGAMRVVESNHLRAVAPPGGARQILPLCSCEVVQGEAQPQVLVHVRALVLLGLHGVEELLELRHVGLGHLRLHPAVRQIREACVADHVARVAHDHEAAGVPLVRGQGQLRGEALRLHQRLVVCSRKTLALWLPSSRSSGPLETVPELVASPHTTLPVDTPPLVAVKVQSRLSGGRPGDGQRGARERSGGCEARRGCCARGRQRARRPPW